MDILNDLEMLATSAASFHEDESVDVDANTIQRWRSLFGYTASEAAVHITDQRQDITALVSHELWEDVTLDPRYQDHDRESYSHWLRKCARSQPIDPVKRAGKLAPMSPDEQFLLRMEGPLSSTVAIQKAAGMKTLPRVLPSTTDEGEEISFCLISSTDKQRILSWLGTHNPGFQPLFVPYSIAPKALSECSIAPTLGIDATLPQYRLNSPASVPRPQNNEYPVWYFFYGTLADPQRLQRAFRRLDNEETKYELRPAKVKNARLTTWAGKYNALVDGVSEVKGSAFKVMSREHEDELRMYETAMYEVVRCDITCLDGDGEQVVQGCTFRFAGSTTGD